MMLTTHSQRVYMNQIYASNVMQQVSDMWKRELLCDAIIKTGTCNVKAHRLVLIAACPMLQNTENANVGSHLEVRLNSDISPNSVHTFLQYLYEGFMVLTEENCKEVEKIAKLLHVDSIAKCCSDFMNGLDSGSQESFTGKFDMKDFVEFKYVCSSKYLKSQESQPSKRSSNQRMDFSASKRQRFDTPSSQFNSPESFSRQDSSEMTPSASRHLSTHKSVIHQDHVVNLEADGIEVINKDERYPSVQRRMGVSVSNYVPPNIPTSNKTHNITKRPDTEFLQSSDQRSSSSREFDLTNSESPRGWSPSQHRTISSYRSYNKKQAQLLAEQQSATSPYPVQIHTKSAESFQYHDPQTSKHPSQEEQAHSNLNQDVFTSKHQTKPEQRQISIPSDIRIFYNEEEPSERVNSDAKCVSSDNHNMQTQIEPTCQESRELNDPSGTGGHCSQSNQRQHAVTPVRENYEETTQKDQEKSMSSSNEINFVKIESEDEEVDSPMYIRESSTRGDNKVSDDGDKISQLQVYGSQSYSHMTQNDQSYSQEMTYHDQSFSQDTVYGELRFHAFSKQGGSPGIVRIENLFIEKNDQENIKHSAIHNESKRQKVCHFCKSLGLKNDVGRPILTRHRCDICQIPLCTVRDRNCFMHYHFKHYKNTDYQSQETSQDLSNFIQVSLSREFSETGEGNDSNSQGQSEHDTDKG